MSIGEIKKLFYDATNQKVVISSPADHSEGLLRKAITLSKNIENTIWPGVTAYRLAHLLFRKAKTVSDLKEILDLTDYSENSDAETLKLKMGLVKFAAIHRLNRLVDTKMEGALKQAQLEIVRSVQWLKQNSNRTGILDQEDQPIQDYYFNILEYMTYMAGTDYAPLLGIAYNDKNTLFPDAENQVWRLIGPNGAIDHFSYNYEIGHIELSRIIEEEKPDGWYILGASGFGNELHTSIHDRIDKNTNRIRILNEIIISGPTGVKASDLAEMISPTNYETNSDVGSREKPGESMVKQHRSKIKEILGKDVFVQTTAGRAGASWALTKDAKILGLVNQKHFY